MIRQNGAPDRDGKVDLDDNNQPLREPLGETP
jgi:hypothetical protein